MNSQLQQTMQISLQKEEPILNYVGQAILALITVPILLLSVTMTLYSCYSMLDWSVKAWARGEDLTGTGIAFVITFMVSNYKFFMVHWKRGQSKEGDGYEEILGSSSSKNDETAVGVSTPARLIAMLAMPAPLLLVSLGVLVNLCNLTDLCGRNELPKHALLAFLYLWPFAVTWHACAGMKSRQFIGRSNEFVIQSDHGWTRGYIADIVEVDVEPLPAISERKYDECDESHHALRVKLNSGNHVFLSLAPPYSAKDRERLFAWFRTRLAPECFTAQAAKFIFEQKLESKHDEPVPARDLTIGEEIGFTALWDSDLNTHMARTNYAPLAPGHELQDGRFTVRGYLSSGGFCTTYLCTDERGQRVVLKESSLPAGLSDDAQQQISDMFKREARLLQRCKHERIAGIFDSFNEKEREYLVLEFVDGVSLAHMVRKSGGVKEEQAVRWFVQMADFLRYLHQLTPPVIHRDFTPENLMVTSSGDLHLIDFGAANDFIGQATGTLIGKQSYIAPEQLQGRACPQSDIYAFGATAYFVLTGKEPLPLSEMAPDNCCDELRNVISECTRFEKEKRIQTASDLFDRLLSVRRV